MSKWLQYTLGLAALVVAGSIAFVCWKLSVVLDSWGTGGAQAFAGMNQALDTVNRPCGGGHPCGTLASLDKTQAKIGDLLVTSQLQERDIAKAAQQNMAAVNGLTRHLNATADALTGTATGAKVTLQQAQVDLDTLNTSIAATKPLLDAATKTVNDVDFYATDPHIQAFVANLDPLSKNAVAITGSAATITGNLAAVSTKASNDYLHPPPWYRRVFTYSGDAIDIAAALARASH